MKKILLLFAIVLSVVSCQQEETPQSSKIINVQIRASDWLSHVDSTKSSRYYYYDSKVPELNSNVYNNGSVSAFVEEGTLVQSLPYTIREGASKTNWTRSTTFTYTEGKIMFSVIYPTLNSFPPDVLNFRVVLNN